MVSAGFGCNFEDDKVVISATRPNRQTLCERPMLNSLFFLDIEYLPAPSTSKTRIPKSHHSNKMVAPMTPTLPPPLQPSSIIEENVAYFSRVPVDANLWHAQKGHIGEKATIHILRSTTGAAFPDGKELLKCESCIISKHHDVSYPPTHSPSPDNLLELILCNICGPFPIPHLTESSILLSSSTPRVNSMNFTTW
jgi:hypothetical protein